MTDRELEFFTKLKELCIEYNASISGSNTEYYPTFELMVDSNEFDIININMPETYVHGNRYDLKTRKALV